jgi:hypothetical protein
MEHPWYHYLGFSTWGKALEILVTVFMGLLALSYTNSNSVFERFFYAFLVALMTWMLAFMVRWTFIWLGDVFKKDQ